MDLAERRGDRIRRLRGRKKERRRTKSEHLLFAVSAAPLRRLALLLQCSKYYGHGVVRLFDVRGSVAQRRRPSRWKGDREFEWRQGGGTYSTLCAAQSFSERRAIFPTPGGKEALPPGRPRHRDSAVRSPCHRTARALLCVCFFCSGSEESAHRQRYVIVPRVERRNRTHPPPKNTRKDKEGGEEDCFVCAIVEGEAE